MWDSVRSVVWTLDCDLNMPPIGSVPSLLERSLKYTLLQTFGLQCRKYIRTLLVYVSNMI